MLLSTLIAIIPVIPHVSTPPPSPPPSGQCAYQEKINSDLWRCYSNEEYANIQKEKEEQREEQKNQCRKDVDKRFWSTLIGGFLFLLFGIVIMGGEMPGIGFFVGLFGAMLVLSLHC